MKKISKIRIQGHGIMFAFVLLATLSACKHQPLVLPAQPKNPVDTTTNGNGGNGGNGSGNNPPEVFCSPDTVYFVQQILPIFQSNCAMSGCHDAATHKKDIILDNYANIMASGEINLNNPTNSDLYEVLLETDPDKRMPQPPANPLTGEQIAMILTWMQQGGLNNACANSVCDTADVKFSTSIKPIIDNKCKGCHSGGSPSGGIDLSTHGGVSTVAVNGKLSGAVNHVTGYFPMPKNGNKLNLCELAKIRIWIDAGALNN